MGYTAKSALIRLKEHNRSCNRWTRHNSPFQILYTEMYQIKTEAIRREHFLKSGQGRKWLDANITIK